METKELLEILNDELKTEALKSLLKKQFLSKASIVDGLDFSNEEHLNFAVDNYIMMLIDPTKAIEELMVFIGKVKSK